MSTIKVHAPGEDESSLKLLMEASNARVGQPRLVISKEAKQVWLELTIEMAIPKANLAVVDDYFKADVLLSVANTQLDLEDEVKLKVTRTARREVTAEA